MAEIKPLLTVLISSKQAEFAAERADIRDIMRPMPLLAADSAENWPPESMAVERKSVEQGARCSIYVGLFACVYSEPTVEEYEAAARNPNRELLIYIRDCPERNAALVEFLDRILHPKQGHTIVQYRDWNTVRTRFADHLWSAIERMIQHLLRLGNPPVAMAGRGSVVERRWAYEKQQLLELGLPAHPAAALAQAEYLQQEVLSR
jgi:hypothetical protein